MSDITPQNTTVAPPHLEHPVHWVASDSELAELCGRWQSLPMIAVDTEFMRSQTYYPQPALVQINDGAGNYLIDPLAIEDFTPLRELLRNRGVVKVLHSCSEDLEVFQTLLGAVPENIFDTQIAAALAGHGFSLGYANLVQQVLNASLPKDETRSDWLQRPLSQPQILYAAIDVEYLLVVAEKLRARLQSLGRLSWLEEDEERLASAMRSGQEPEHFYLRIKSAWRLNRPQLNVLKRLAAWRETLAQERNVPRNRVVKEHVLLSLARDNPQHLGELRKYEGMTERVIRTDGAAILELVRQARESDPATWPEPLPKPLSPLLAGLMKKLKNHVQRLAEQLDVAPEALLRKKDYEMLVRNAAAAVKRGEAVVLPENLQGWRASVVGESLLALINADEDLARSRPGKQEGAEPAETGDRQENEMICDIYRSSRREGMYLYLTHKAGLDRVPEALMREFGKAELAMTLTLSPDRTLARVDAEQVIEALRDKGYFLQMPPRPETYMQDINTHNAKLTRR